MIAKKKGWLIPALVASFLSLALFASTRTGFSQSAVLAEANGCTTPTDSQYCTANANNPCGAVPQGCFDYFRWFTNVLQCDDIPGKTVASGMNAVPSPGSWSVCQGGSTPGYSCIKEEMNCGSMEIYAGACGPDTFCGDAIMEACMGLTPYDCL